MLGVDSGGVRLRPAVAGVIEGVITRTSNCTAQTCPLLLLSASNMQSRVPIRNQQDWSFLFSFQAPWEGDNRHKRRGLQDQEWWEWPQASTKLAKVSCKQPLERANRWQPRPRKTAAQTCSWLRNHSLGPEGMLWGRDETKLQDPNAVEAPGDHSGWRGPGRTLLQAQSGGVGSAMTSDQVAQGLNQTSKTSRDFAVSLGPRFNA